MVTTYRDTGSVCVTSAHIATNSCSACKHRLSCINGTRCNVQRARPASYDGCRSSKSMPALQAARVVSQNNMYLLVVDNGLHGHLHQRMSPYNSEYGRAMLKLTS
jgi:hypothetical protein